MELRALKYLRMKGKSTQSKEILHTYQLGYDLVSC